MPRKIDAKWGATRKHVGYQPEMVNLKPEDRFYSDAFFKRLARDYDFNLPKSKKKLSLFKSCFEYAAREYLALKFNYETEVKPKHVREALSSIQKDSSSLLFKLKNMDYKTSGAIAKSYNQYVRGNFEAAKDGALTYLFTDFLEILEMIEKFSFEAAQGVEGRAGRPLETAPVRR